MIRVFSSYDYTLITSAVLPAVALLVYIYRKDRLEKESPWMLFSLLAMGALSIIPAVACEFVGTYLLNRALPYNDGLYLIFDNFIVVALSEEGFKYLMLRRRTWESPEFNCMYDGVVYSVFVSLGFAIFENIQYVFSYGFAVAILRAVTAVPGHACFGVFMGVWYGVAKRCEGYGNSALSNCFSLLALVSAVIMHGAYDYTASLTGTRYSGVFFYLIVIMFVICFILVKRVSDSDYFIDDSDDYTNNYY